MKNTLHTQKSASKGSMVYILKQNKKNYLKSNYWVEMKFWLKNVTLFKTATKVLHYSLWENSYYNLQTITV